jgi:hypothetical protein
LAAALYLAAWLLGVLVLVAWSMQVAAGWRQGLAALLLLALAGAALRAWTRSPRGLLAWDGQDWRWADGAGDSPGQVAVALDLQRWLLVRWRADGARAAWLWLERAREPNAWNALRRAVYSPARTDAPPGATPPSAIP